LSPRGEKRWFSIYAEMIREGLGKDLRGKRKRDLFIFYDMGNIGRKSKGNARGNQRR